MHRQQILGVSHEFQAAAERSADSHGARDNAGDELERPDRIGAGLEWGGIAKDATIVFVTSANVGNSWAYIIDNNLAPVLSISYGNCEADMGADEVKSLAALFQLANAEWTRNRNPALR